MEALNQEFKLPSPAVQSRLLLLKSLGERRVSAILVLSFPKSITDTPFFVRGFRVFRGENSCGHAG